MHASLNRLGVLTAKDIEALTAQVSGVSEAVRIAGTGKEIRCPPGREESRGKRPAAKKPAAKRR